MNKRQFIAPYILLTNGLSDGGDDGVTGGGSGQGGVIRPTDPMSYTDWLNSDWAEDLVGMNGIDEYDYATWWESWGFSRADWDRLNPGLNWEDYFDD